MYGQNRPLCVIQRLDSNAVVCLCSRLELEHIPKLTTLVTTSTAIAAAIPIAIATKICGATSGTMGGASGTTSTTIIFNSSSHYNQGVK